MIILGTGLAFILGGILKFHKLKHDDITGHWLCILSWLIGGVLSIIGVTKCLT